MEEENLEIRSDEELWNDLLILEGESKADALSSLAISYSATENSQYAIALAKEATANFIQSGFTGNEVEFIWVWGVLAESNAYLENYNEAIEAGLKCYELCMEHIYPGYESIRWDLIQWYLSAYRFEEAREQFEMLHDRYKFASEIDYTSLMGSEND